MKRMKKILNIRFAHDPIGYKILFIQFYAKFINPNSMHRFIIYIISSLIIYNMFFISNDVYANAAEISIFVNGNEISTDVQPILIYGRVMVPARYIAESLGAKVEWDPIKRAIIIYQSEEQKISFEEIEESTVSNIRIIINGQEIHTDVSAHNINGRVLVPARYIAEPLGASVSWDSHNKRVIINKHILENRITSNQSVFPFTPTDIFIFDLANTNQSTDEYLNSNSYKDYLDVLNKAHISVVGSANNMGKQDSYYLSESSNIAFLKKLITNIHNEGLKYVTCIRSDASISPSESQAFNAACLDVEGNKIYQWMPPAGRPWNSIHNPIWREFLFDSAKVCVDNGTDYFAIDTWTLNLDVTGSKFNGDFSEYSLSGFRDYLKNSYSQHELEVYGIENINSFDYGDFIRMNHLNLYKKNRNEVPLFVDFLDYQLQSSKEFWEELVCDVKKYAEENGRKVFFTVNVPVSDNKRYHDLVAGLPIHDIIEGYMSEFNYGYPPECKTIPYSKLMKSMGKPMVIQPNCGTSNELYARKDIEELVKIFTAESYASGEFAYVPYAFCMAGQNDWVSYNANANKLYPYYDFISDHETYYNNLVTTSKMAVLYSYSSVKNTLTSSENFFGICNLILDGHMQYDAVFAGDNIWIDDSLTLDKLIQYDLIILPNVKYISDEQLALILNYVKLGGKIYAFGETAAWDEFENIKVRTELNDLLIEGSHQYGLGQFVYELEDVGSKYLINRNADIRLEIVNTFNTLSKEGIQTNASHNVSILEYWNIEQESDIIHLINYDYNTDDGHINQQSNISMEVVLNSKLLGKKLGVYYSSPDYSTTKVLEYSINNNTISFTIPSLDTYGIIYIGSVC